jgi:hypothetical protein
VVEVACLDLLSPAGLAGEAKRAFDKKEMRDGKKRKETLQMEGRSSK